MIKYRFYKDELGWFIDLKWFPFGKTYLKGMLAMIGESDKLLDLLAQGENEVTLQVRTWPIPYADGHLEKQISSLTGGAIYKSNKGFSEKYNVESVNTAWLCPVTLWVFLKYPEKIYYKVL